MIPGWVEAIEDDVSRCVCEGEGVSPQELAERLGVPVGSAVALICLLAAEGRLEIERVSRPSGAEHRPGRWALLVAG